MSTETQRKPKQLTIEQIEKQIEGLSLSDRVDLFKSLKEGLQGEKQLAQQQVQLLETNLK